jgi:hypothetical protein
LRSQRFNNNEEIMGGCQNMAELTGGRLLWQKHAKTLTVGVELSVIQKAKFRRLNIIKIFSHC